MERIAYYNGQIGAPNELTIPFLDRVNFFGDGVYEAAMTANGGIFLADEHIDRFYRSAEAISIDIGMPKAELKAILLDVVRRTETAMPCCTGRSPAVPPPESTPSPILP